MRKLLVMILICAISYGVKGDAVHYSQDRNKSDYSKIIEVNGEKMILLPDGRQLPFGSGVICSDDCPEITTPASHRPLLWLLIPAGIITTVLLWPTPETPQPPRSVIGPTPTPTPRRDVPSRPIAPPVEVPEPGTFALSLAGLGLFLRRRARVAVLTLAFLALPAIAGTTIRIDPTAIDGNRDGRDDFWRGA